MHMSDIKARGNEDITHISELLVASIERAEPSRYQTLIEPELRASPLPVASAGVAE
jgi:hypothetical protein